MEASGPKTRSSIRYTLTGEERFDGDMREPAGIHLCATFSFLRALSFASDSFLRMSTLLWDDDIELIHQTIIACHQLIVLPKGAAGHV